jgi:alginate O-acetyltransferase complex protein AlgI
MVFASPIFIFFLPLTLAAYDIPRPGKNVVLLVASLVFYIWGEGLFVALVIASVLANWAFGLAIGGAGNAVARKRWLVAGVTRA